jgi:hypothetical protein
VLALVPFGVLAAWHAGWSPAASMGDYAQYLLHARALLEGRSYTDIGYIYQPETADIGPPAYPPGLPLVLVPILALTGLNMAVLRLFTLACTALFGILAYARLSRDLPAPVAATGIAFALFDIEAQLGTLAPISDPPFCALFWLLVLVADSRDRWSWRRTAAVTALGFALIGFRLAGVAIVPALCLFALLRRSTHGTRPLVPVAIWSTVGLASVALGISGLSYANAVRGGGFVARLISFTQHYRLALFNAELYPLAADRLNDAYHLLITPVVLIGAVVVGRRLGASLVSCFTVAYAVMLVAVRVGDERYLWPLLPLIGASLAQGVATLAARLVRRPTGVQEGPGRLPWAATVIPALVVAGALAGQRMIPAPFAITGTQDAKDLYQWLSTERSREPMRVMFDNPRVLTLSSGVPAMGLPERTTPGHLVAIDARHITHLVWQRPDVSGCIQRLANELPVLFPERFELVYTNPTFKVFRVRSADTPFRGAFERVNFRHPERFCPVG